MILFKYIYAMYSIQIFFYQTKQNKFVFFLKNKSMFIVLIDLNFYLCSSYAVQLHFFQPRWYFR